MSRDKRVNFHQRSRSRLQSTQQDGHASALIRVMQSHAVRYGPTCIQAVNRPLGPRIIIANFHNFHRLRRKSYKIKPPELLDIPGKQIRQISQDKFSIERRRRRLTKFASGATGDRFKSMVERLFQVVLSAHRKRLDGLSSAEKLPSEAAKFETKLQAAFTQARKGRVSQSENALYHSLREALSLRYLRGLYLALDFAFNAYMTRGLTSETLTTVQRDKADFRYPFEWYPATRAMQREIFVHVGPTNSGKTYNALKALESAKSGIYAGPLRLLAHEVYSRLNAKGIPCGLLTGEEIRSPEDSDLFFRSCTVEMTPVNIRVDVAVIDEVQMLADNHRGSPWVSAFLGVQAKHVHVCGEERAVDLVQELCARTGDKVRVIRYQRLNPIRVEDSSLQNNLLRLQKGDAVIAFSRLTIYALKQNIERATRRRCAVVYGSLPPEVRVQQAALFNDPDNDYDYIAASDAIGMGLNLEIKRVIFEGLTRFDGSAMNLIPSADVKQIGGRAGRFKAWSGSKSVGKSTRREIEHDISDPNSSCLDIRVPQPIEKPVERPIEQLSRIDMEQPSATEMTALQAQAQQVRKASPGTGGTVTTLSPEDFRAMKQAFYEPLLPLEECVVQPSPAWAVDFADFYPFGTPFSFIMQRIMEVASVAPLYKLVLNQEFLEISDAIQHIPLTNRDRAAVSQAPTNGTNPVLVDLCISIAKKRPAIICDMNKFDLEVLDSTPSSDNAVPYLKRLEELQICLTLYLWLSYRFPTIMVNQALAFHIRDQVNVKMIETLATMRHRRIAVDQRRSLRRNKAVLVQSEKEKYLGSDKPEIESTSEQALSEPDEFGNEFDNRRDWKGSTGTTEGRVRVLQTANRNPTIRMVLSSS